MYELFILGELKDKPMHGYLLHQILSYVIGPLRQISWGTLYSVLRKMEANGHIRQMSEETSVNGRTRKLYEITPEGDACFARLMRQPFEHNSDTEDLFRVKRKNFNKISIDVQLDIVRQYRTFLEVMIGVIDVHDQQIANNPEITAGERPCIQSVLDYERSTHEAKLTWVEAELARLVASA